MERFGLKLLPPFHLHNLCSVITLHEPEVSICKAFKGEVVVCYFEPLITQHMGTAGLSSYCMHGPSKFLVGIVIL